MNIRDLIKQYEELENNGIVLDSMEDETGKKEIVEHTLDDGEDLGLFIQTTGSLYNKYLAPALEKGTKIAWDRLVAEGAKLYRKEIEDKKFSAADLKTAKEYIQDYYAGELTAEQLKDTGRNYQTLTVKPKNEDFKKAVIKKAKYKTIKARRFEKEKALLKESDRMTMDVLRFKLGDADVKVNNQTGKDLTVEDIKNAIKEENPRIYFNEWDSYYYIMDFSFLKDDEKFWIESKYISGDYKQFEFNVYQGLSETSRVSKQFECVGKSVNINESVNLKPIKEGFEDIKPQVDEAIKKWIDKNNWGQDYIEIYADYRDELDEDSIKEILDNPEDAYGIIDSLYFDNGYFGDEEYDYAFNQLELDKEIKEEYEDEIRDYFRDRIGICADYSHFLTDVRVDILIGEQVPDTYTFEDDKLVDVSDAVKFFIEKQGHTVQEFLDHYNSLPDFENGTGKTGYDYKTFFGSLVSEVDNAYRDYWYQPVIMGHIDLEEYVKNPNAKQLEIPANAYCGLTDRTNGTCSTIEINLEKPFTIDKDADDYDINYYHGYKYSVDSICGLTSKCWDDAEIKLVGEVAVTESVSVIGKALKNYKRLEDGKNPIKLKKATYKKIKPIKIEKDRNGEKALKENADIQPSISYDKRENKYACFATENGGAVKYTDTKEEAEQFLIDKYNVKKEDIKLIESKCKRGRKRAKFGESNTNPKYPIEKVIDGSEVKVYLKPEHQDISFRMLFKTLELGGTEESKKFWNALLREKSGTIAVYRNEDTVTAFHYSPNTWEDRNFKIEAISGVLFDDTFHAYGVDKKKNTVENYEDKTVNFMNKNLKYEVISSKENKDLFIIYVGEGQLEHDGEPYFIHCSFDNTQKQFYFYVQYEDGNGSDLEDWILRDEVSNADINNLKNMMYDEMNHRNIDESINEEEKTYYLYAGYYELYLTDHKLTPPYMYQAENTDLNQLINDNISEIDDEGEWTNPDAAFSTDSATICFDKNIIDELNKTDLFGGEIDMYHDALSDAEFNGEDEDKVKENYHIYDLSKYYADKNEAMNEISLETAEKVNTQRQVNALKAEMDAKALKTPSAKKKEKEAADKATKSNKLFKSWKKAKGITESEEKTVVTFDEGKHEIVKCSNGYYNKYNIVEGKPRFKTKCVKNLPTALGALKRRFPNAEEDK